MSAFLDDRRQRETDAVPSPNLRRLLERMWQLGYGTIRELHVRAGEPLLDPPPLIRRTARCDERIAAQRASPFALKREHFAFRRMLAATGTGVIHCIKVHDGLPVVLEFDEQF